MDGAPPPDVDPSFDRFAGNVTFFLADHVTTASVPIPVLNAYYDESLCVTLNYGAQLGACLVMLLVVLALTPVAKLGRLSAVLHVVGLALCVVRSGLLFAYFVSPFSHFYQVWANDFSQIPARYWDASLAANTLSLPLVVIMQAALMNQAWTMVAFWPRVARYVACALSAVIVLLTVGTRLAFTIVQNHAIVTAIPPEYFFWGIHWTVIMGAISIFWFCAVFNVKLVSHLIQNRGILPSTSLINPMEVLIMTNGTLMVIPSIFAGLEWAKFTNFESGSLTLTSVIIILPLGTLAAQRISSQGSQSYQAGSDFRRQQQQQQQLTQQTQTRGVGHRSLTKPSSSVTFSCGSPVTPQISAGSKADVSLMDRSERMDPIDLELSRIDACRESSECSQSTDQRRRMQSHDLV
ncbi:mating-type alpha-pheromone receptor PreB [Cordyceps militaris CM01]|uniref:Mating-type alpha-pheromone receptor PreB n=1 Tax=Cordyceps militaris (strain CM01) TaxID=983644 RepID=G3JKW0_CORMM|nr:mating-type alpha-pheromone receptor PreB [Cordyceps militaris CM01]EGX90334.1 mating-type alpha-pheromone receptor PreB [Cordyceps militaris CM01]